MLDERKLKHTGHQTLTSWMVCLVPVYLWKRAELLNQKKYYFWAWCAALFISMLIGVSNSAGRIESVACNTVSDIIQNQLRQDVTCKRVKITKTDDDTYYGKALLSNGNDVRIRIQKQGNGQIYVEIL